MAVGDAFCKMAFDDDFSVPERPSDDLKLLYVRMGGAMTMMLWGVMYSIKFSLLMLYRSLFGVSQRFRRWWGVVAVFTFVSFALCFTAPAWTCPKIWSGNEICEYKHPI